jgi:hypothetical protein
METERPGYERAATFCHDRTRLERMRAIRSVASGQIKVRLRPNFPLSPRKGISRSLRCDQPLRNVSSEARPSMASRLVGLAGDPIGVPVCAAAATCRSVRTLTRTVNAARRHSLSLRLSLGLAPLGDKSPHQHFLRLNMRHLKSSGVSFSDPTLCPTEATCC